MEHPNQQFPLEGSLQLQASTGGLISQTSPTQSLSPEDHSPGLNVTTRRRSLPNTRSNKILPGNINTQQPAARSTKSMSAGAQERTSHGSLMNMTGTMGAANEITYTPTTHRISKAKKGKKVHACEYPGCSKVWLLCPICPIISLSHSRSLLGPSIASTKYPHWKINVLLLTV